MYRATYCARNGPLPLLPSGPGGVGGIGSRRTRHSQIISPRKGYPKQPTLRVQNTLILREVCSPSTRIFVKTKSLSCQNATHSTENPSVSSLPPILYVQLRGTQNEVGNRGTCGSSSSRSAQLRAKTGREPPRAASEHRSLWRSSAARQRAGARQGSSEIRPTATASGPPASPGGTTAAAAEE